eukprot:GFUD01015397.1.p1 GENE.GFUD01015397.1~~GFUD01015397.1.p1  ORF type:complete len:1122 (+),score=237.76 GFUD01015397.1:136-3501(+)
MGERRKLYINQFGSSTENKEHRKTDSQNIVRLPSDFKSELRIFFYEQIRTSNIFFLFISILDLVPDIQPGSKFSTISALVLIILMNGLFTLWNHRQKSKSNKLLDEMSDFEVGEFNLKESKKRNTLLGGVGVKFTNSTLLKDLSEGDIIRFHPNRGKPIFVPADLLLLGVECSCHQHDDNYTCGRCSISMANLTGDSRVLDRQAPEKTAERYKPNLLDYSAVVDYSGPTPDVEVFEGTLDITSEHSPDGPVQLSNTNFVPRGSLLLNAVTVVGMVVYVGRDTKVAFHMTGQKQRCSIINQMVDKNLILIIYVISAVSFFLAFLGSKAEEAAIANSHLDNLASYSFLTKALQWLMVLQKCVPISLIVSIEFINLVLARRISKDDSATVGKAAINSKLVDELGRVTHLFLDKNISGDKLEVELVGYGTGIINLSTEDRTVTGTVEPNEDSEDDKHNEERIKCLLAICNKIELDQTQKQFGHCVEDQAQVDAARRMGYALEKKSSKIIMLQAKDKSTSYEILETIPFSTNSDLSGMYIKEKTELRDIPRLVIKGSPESVKKFLHSRKGSSASILKSVQKGVSKLKTLMTTNEEKIQDFSARGYQTVWFAEGVLDEKEHSALVRYLESSEYRKLENSERKLQMLTEVLAPDTMNVVGSIGMIQKVDEEAQNTIKDLRNTGIKMCLVTEDSHEHSKLYASELGILAHSGSILSKELPLKEINFEEVQQTLKRLDEMIQRKDRMNLAVSGISFKHIIESNCERKLQKVCDQAGSIIFTSMRTSQRPELVKLFSSRSSNEMWKRVKSRCSIRMARKTCVLVVGNSSDDIPMMKEGDISVFKDKSEDESGGHVGVTDASNGADFVISDLKSLKNLILVHGIWNKRSMTQMLYFFIYKNLLLTLIPVLHGLFSGSVVVDIFSPMNYSSYNAFITFFFTLSIGHFYTGYNRQEISENPCLYREQRNGISTRLSQLGLWCTSALLHAFIIYAFGYLAFGDVVTQDGRVLGRLDLGSYFFIVIVITVSLKLMVIEAMILPMKGTNLQPRFFLSWPILGLGSISVIFSIIVMFIDSWNIHLPRIFFSDTQVSRDTADSLWCWAALLLSTVTCLVFNLGQKVVWFMAWRRDRDSV